MIAMRAQLLVATATLSLVGACATTDPAPVLPALATTAEELPGWRFGGELQAYPAGVTAMALATHPIQDDDDFIFRLGYNYTDRSDFGEHDEESGGGWGLGIGSQHYFAGRYDPGWLVGVRLDAWWLTIDWEDDARMITPQTQGSTDVVVLVPVVEGGYAWPGKSGDLILTFGFGWEFNVWTSGEDVGDGPILLAGVRYIL
jgi:hypothetical protein